MHTGKRTIKEPLPRALKTLGLLLLTLCGHALATAPPSGTVTALNNVGLFDGSQNLLTTCVTLQNADGTNQLDASGKPRRFDIAIKLNSATLTFQLLANVPVANANLDCSGVYRAGAFTDAVLITNLNANYTGAVWNLTMDYLAGSNLEFKLRLDSTFTALRNFASNTTALGSDLGEFAQSAVREYTTANMGTSIAIKLPQCSDAQGDENLVTLKKNGVALGAGIPGSSFAWSTSGLTAGDYLFTVSCSDQVGVQTLAAAKGMAFSASYVATSQTAPGTLTIRITQAAPVGEFTFNFGASTSTSDQELIREAALFARAFFTTTFGRTLEKNATITTLGATGGCSNPGASAFAGSQTVTFCIGNRGWTDHQPVTRRKIVMHEVFHLLQFELRWLGGSNAGSHWLIEGSAEYMGWLGVAAQGHLTLATARGCMTKEVADFALQQPPGLGNLSSYETAQSFGGGPVYPLSMIGVDQLVSGSNVGAILTYGHALAAGTTATTAFSNSFGTTTTAFYAQFPAYRTGLTVPSTYLCRI